jgi:hypothetical protein
MAFATIGTRGIQAQSVDLSSKVTGTLPVPNGGLGIASGTTGQFLKFTGTETLASAADNAAHVKLEHKNVTSAASTINFEQKFSATYKNYFLLCSHITPSTDNTSIYMRFLTGTDTPFTTTSYNYSCTDYNNTDTNNSFFGANVAQARFTRGIDNDNTDVGRGSFILNIMTPNDTTHPPEYLWHASYRNVTQRPMAVGSGTLNSTSAFTGIQFYMDSGNVAEFTGTLYGIVE